jgi:phosphoribosylamine--glycine ligase
VTIALVSGGYPGDYEKEKRITGLEGEHRALVFHAGTKTQHEHIVTDGGRVLAVTGKGKSLQEARQAAYERAGKIGWEGLYFRKDIGEDLLNYKGI